MPAPEDKGCMAPRKQKKAHRTKRRKSLELIISELAGTETRRKSSLFFRQREVKLTSCIYRGREHKYAKENLSLKERDS